MGMHPFLLASAFSAFNGLLVITSTLAQTGLADKTSDKLFAAVFLIIIYISYISVACYLKNILIIIAKKEKASKVLKISHLILAIVNFIFFFIEYFVFKNLASKKKWDDDELVFPQLITALVISFIFETISFFIYLRAIFTKDDDN